MCGPCQLLDQCTCCVRTSSLNINGSSSFSSSRFSCRRSSSDRGSPNVRAFARAGCTSIGAVATEFGCVAAVACAAGAAGTAGIVMFSSRKTSSTSSCVFLFSSQLNGGVSGKMCSSSVYWRSWVISTKAPGLSGLARSIVCLSLRVGEWEQMANALVMDCMWVLCMYCIEYYSGLTFSNIAHRRSVITISHVHSS